jgi:nitrile hydratase beta subunit
MDGMHDLGGKQGFGRVAYPSPPHDETWEPLVRALSAFALKKHIYNMDEFRHAIERMVPRHYINAPYYERHLTAVATLLVEKDVIAREELESHVDGAFPLAGSIGPGRQAVPPQTFAIGERVRVKNEYVTGHHRMPGYIRGKVGVVVGISPPYPFPDSAGHGMQPPMEPTCDVRFRSCDL